MRKVFFLLVIIGAMSQESKGTTYTPCTNGNVDAYMPEPSNIYGNNFTEANCDVCKSDSNAYSSCLANYCFYGLDCNACDALNLAENGMGGFTHNDCQKINKALTTGMAKNGSYNLSKGGTILASKNATDPVVPWLFNNICKLMDISDVTWYGCQNTY